MANIPNIGYLSGSETPEQVIDHVAKLQKMVEFLATGNISSVNAREFGGWRVGLTELQSRAGDVGMSTANDAEDPVRLWAGSTDKNTAPWRVYQSGRGVATGWKIQSKDGEYPNVVLDPDGDLIAAYLDEFNYLAISPSFGGVPGMYITKDGNTAFSWTVAGGAANMYSSAMPLQIGTDTAGDIYLLPEVGYHTIVRGWDELMTSGGQTLLDALIALETALAGKAAAGSSTGSAGGHNHGIADGTKLAVDGGGFVTWVSAGGHSHTQT